MPRFAIHLSGLLFNGFLNQSARLLRWHYRCGRDADGFSLFTCTHKRLAPKLLLFCRQERHQSSAEMLDRRISAGSLHIPCLLDDCVELFGDVGPHTCKRSIFGAQDRLNQVFPLFADKGWLAAKGNIEQQPNTILV
jgi:hypothetical protein